tara:strand:+ start:279 stop:596 length:318 start_codon:yes stop_codon:yes gene_type:complete
VPKPNNKLPQDVIDHWPEILKDVDVSVVPLAYLHSMRIIFTDGKVWEVDIEKSMQSPNADSLETEIETLIEEYNDQIENIDFRLNVHKVKQDITKRTKFFLKKGK